MPKPRCWFHIICAALFTTVLSAALPEDASAQEKKATQAQMDRANKLYTDLAKMYSLRAVYDGASERLYYGLILQQGGNPVRGWVSPGADALMMGTFATEGRYRLISLERITYDTSGTETGRSAATQTQLDSLTERFFAANGKLNSLFAGLTPKGDVVFEFLTEDGKDVNGTILLHPAKAALPRPKQPPAKTPIKKAGNERH